MLEGLMVHPEGVEPPTARFDKSGIKSPYSYDKLLKLLILYVSLYYPVLFNFKL